MECIFALFMNKALISLGTNEDREVNLALCHQLLNNIFPEIHYSETSLTSPYGKTYINDFLNQLAVFYTDKEKEEIHDLLKSIEEQIGRHPSDKENGIIKIDIDLVIWNDAILKPNDIKRSYVANLLPTLRK